MNEIHWNLTRIILTNQTMEKKNAKFNNLI